MSVRKCFIKLLCTDHDKNIDFAFKILMLILFLLRV